MIALFAVAKLLLVTVDVWQCGTFSDEVLNSLT